MGISLSHADLNQPYLGQELNYIYVLFDWDQEPNAGLYNLQISNSRLFDNVILDINEETTVYIERDTLAWANTYYWRVRPMYGDNSYGEWSEISYFTTGEPILAERQVNIYNDDAIQDGFIMYGWLTGAVDKFGNEIWNTQELTMNHINNYGQLFGNLGGISPGRAGEYNYSNNAYLWITPDETFVDEHEIKQIQNGNYMSFVPTYQLGPIPLGDWTQNFQDLGYAADGVTNEFQWMGLRIVEFDKETKQEVWSWDPFEHFTMDDYDLYGGTWWVAYIHLKFDWMHTNAFHFDEEESVIYVSHRHLSRISKISYPSGEVIWNMGLPAEFNTGDQNICTDLLFSFQHHIQMLDDGDLLFFDNGNLSQMLLGDPLPISRARRIRVIDDSYCETVWQYDLPQNLYGSSMGSVQLLENGNYFICTLGDVGGWESSIIEITPENDMVWKLTVEDFIPLYRAYKIPSMHPYAFSVLFDQYRNVNIDGNSFTGIVLDDASSSLSFTIHNQSGYSQPYTYVLSDENGWFNVFSDTITINAYEDFTVTLEPTVQLDSVISLTMDIWPIHHEYALKSMNYDVHHDDSVLSEMEPNIPTEYALFHNYPNPFNPITTLRYDLPVDALVNITVYDMMGRVVRTLVNMEQTAGYRSVIWDATNNTGQQVSAGLYLYTIETGEFRQTKKMVLLK